MSENGEYQNLVKRIKLLRKQTLSLPAYISVADSIEQLIRDKYLENGTKLPPERKLADSLSLSRLTVREAYKNLKTKNLAVQNQRKGFFVSCNHLKMTAKLKIYIPCPKDFKENYQATPYYNLLFFHIFKAANEFKAEIIFCSCREIRPEDNNAAILILPVLKVKEAEYLIKKFKNIIPISFLDWLGQQDNYNVYLPDNEGGILTGINYLQKLGHTKISMVTYNPVPRGSIKIRVEAFVNYMKMKGLSKVDYPVISLKDKHIKITEIIKDPTKRPTALFAVNPAVLLRIYSLLISNRIKIPEDISLLSFGDYGHNSYLLPAVTYIDPFYGEIAEKAVFKLIEQVKLNFATKPGKYIIPAKLVELRSCGKAR